MELLQGAAGIKTVRSKLGTQAMGKPEAIELRLTRQKGVAARAWRFRVGRKVG